MAAGSTYTPLATTTLGSDTASVTFSSISGSYTDLVIIANCYTTHTGSSYITLQFNSDTGGNYSRTTLYGTGSAAGAESESNAGQMATGYSPNTANKYGNSILQINNYSNTTTYKTVIARGNAASSATLATVGLWRSTSAITAIKLMDGNANFGSGSTFTLYGILAA